MRRDRRSRMKLTTAFLTTCVYLIIITCGLMAEQGMEPWEQTETVWNFGIGQIFR